MQVASAIWFAAEQAGKRPQKGPFLLASAAIAYQRLEKADRQALPRFELFLPLHRLPKIKQRPSPGIST